MHDLARPLTGHLPKPTHAPQQDLTVCPNLVFSGGACGTLQEPRGTLVLMVGESRSAWVKVRVRPSALAEVTDFVGDEGLSTWLRQLMGWAVANQWRPGQDWIRKPYVSVGAHQAVTDVARREFAAKETLLSASRMDVARAALAAADPHVMHGDSRDDLPGDDWEPA